MLSQGSDTAVQSAIPAQAACTAFGRRVVEWQRSHGRHDLPWQRDRDPYAIWVSEIMLQQTQVATVIPYYARFMARFPDIATLAHADIDAVLQLWSGLGYYSRARNLHAAARVVVGQYGGELPRDPHAIAALPGIGRSTAAAIAALAFDVRGAILDGNVRRVLCRVFGIDADPAQAAAERTLWALAQALAPERDIAAYTQGVMDLGATVCVRRGPRCGACPLRRDCVALRAGRVDELPRARKRRLQPQRSVAMLMLCHGARILLEKRPAAGIWGGLWSFPESAPDDDAADICERRFGATRLRIAPLPPLEHAFTHFRLQIQPLRIEVGRLRAQAAEPGILWLEPHEARAAAVPAPVRTLLDRL
jgi:A/G-specific adenine glycosylase